MVIIGNPESRPVALFQSALTRQGLPPAQIVAYADLLTGRVALPDIVQAGDIVRIETAGRNFAVEQALLALGADQPDTEGEGDQYDRISRQEVSRLTFDRGRILYPRQWYLGFCAALRMIEAQLAACPPHRLMNTPADIACMFDKRQCHTWLREHTIPIPRSIAAAEHPISSYDELIECMQQHGCMRVFVKLAHGSSASGVVAYQTNGQQHQATTTVELVPMGERLHLYNSRRIRTYRDQREIAALINALCRHHVHVEQWLPKAGIDNQTFDLRIVVIAGQVRHVVVRMSRSPMTNLHLLNQRGDSDLLRRRMGPEAWEAICHTCARVMACFPASLYAGLDVLISPSYHRHAILECNAFGDLLPGVLWEGRDTYEAEVAAMMDGSCRPHAGVLC